MPKEKLKIAILCGGPSLERGISLNSARSVCDHLQSDEIEVLPIYFDHYKNAYEISRGQLYSNTPSDFDFKLQNASKPLSESAFHKLLKSVDLAFPVMHGAFGEDGEIQRVLTKHGIPFIGSDKEACYNCFDKHRSNEIIDANNFFTLPSAVLKIHSQEENKKIIQAFFKTFKLDRAIVKPATGGSSIGVYSVSNVEEAIKASKSIFNKRIDTRVVIEPFCRGIEFTVIVLQNRFGLPVALFPTEIEVDYRDHQIFDYRKKYLATRQVSYHCPPRFSEDVTEKIQIQAEQLFKLLGMRDFARFDGWLMPTGQLWFSDFNPISGMEQNSFLFLQAAQIGFSHSDLLNFIVRNACLRYQIDFPVPKEKKLKRKKINVLFGGATAEKQVSLMSGTNVWLKLRKSDKYEPSPYLLDTDGKTVWRLPYSKTLNHTVEEISEMCRQGAESERTLGPIRKRVLEKIAAKPEHLSEELFVPEKMSLAKFIDQSELIFSGLHGGIGEDGTLQKMLEEKGKALNGPDSKASAICIDKFETGRRLQGLEREGIYVPKKLLLKTSDLLVKSTKELALVWDEIKLGLDNAPVIVKPPNDGCSAGIVKLENAKEFASYISLIATNASHIAPGTFPGQSATIDMPTDRPMSLMFEQFIQTDKVRIVKNKIKWEHVSDWIEITMGLLGKGDKIKALDPSLTVAYGTVLSLEEKFQGGTGVNITPPPQPFVKKKAIKAAKARMEIVAKKLGISGYSRIDAFMDINSGVLMIIEVNTTPALTPSTVIFHQALTETPPIYPLEFLEKIIEYA